MNVDRDRSSELGVLVPEAIVLAGGNSTRMGRDKALLPIGGVPLLVHLARKLLSWGMRVTIAAGHSSRANEYADELRKHGCADGVRFVQDLYPDCGPMAGLHASLRAVPEGFAFVAACDMPFISHSLLVRMADQLSGDVDFIGVPNHPFHALYHTRTVSQLASHLETRRLRMMGLLQELRVVHIEPEGELEEAATANLNDMEIYSRMIKE